MTSRGSSARGTASASLARTEPGSPRFSRSCQESSSPRPARSGSASRYALAGCRRTSTTSPRRATGACSRFSAAIEAPTTSMTSHRVRRSSSSTWALTGMSSPPSCATSRGVRRDGSHCSACFSTSQTCSCSTSRETISTPTCLP